MALKQYDLHLKGFVGGEDFNRKAVDTVLSEKKDCHVDVLIDSTGGNLATGLSISSSFKLHDDVSVHFVGFNASAATIASLGAKHISIDSSAMYLVHQCSMPFIVWASLNSDQFSQLIDDCEKVKADLDKMDLNVARLYARKCKKSVQDLLNLMKEGAWLTADEALEWGFVDEVTDFDEDEAPKLTDKLASAMACEGMPIPDVPIVELEKNGAFARFLSSLASLFKSRTITNQINITMKKTYQFVCAVIGLESLDLVENKTSLTDDQLTALDDHFADLSKKIEEKDASIAEKDAAIAAKDAEIADLKAQLDQKPAEASVQVVDDEKKPANTVEDETADFVATGVSASALFNSLP